MDKNITSEILNKIFRTPDAKFGLVEFENCPIGFLNKIVILKIAFKYRK